MHEYEIFIEDINPCGGEPVSYTHLDVYKRQGYASGRIRIS